ncbi:MAG TPA: isoprenoid biosynthesis glyoxalase ElbB [Tepidisphaeraceae bacterium]|nr:isoprenoid biosynthesis glyoxalase ElbB [Tepidisphaeraceae bacterium]
MSKKIGVVLSGCGVYDGAEITEAVSVLIAIDQLGAEAICVAPNIEQAHTIDHLAGKPTEEYRNVLTESARIARGKIKDIAQVQERDLDALIFPGGFGAAKNLSDFAFKGSDCDVNEHVARLSRAMHAAKKPIGFACIAPVIAAKLFHANVTIGNDTSTSEAITKMGGKHTDAGMTDIVIDEANHIVTTPCYMYDSSPSKVFEGARKMVEAVLKLTR